jgi:hypothetical protein
MPSHLPHPYTVEVTVPAARADRALAELLAYLEHRAGLKRDDDWTVAETRKGDAVTFTFSLRIHARALLFKVAATVLTTPDHPAAIAGTGGAASGTFVQSVRARFSPPAAPPAMAPLPALDDHSFHFG